jgi:hypothetical protein
MQTSTVILLKSAGDRMPPHLVEQVEADRRARDALGSWESPPLLADPVAEVEPTTVRSAPGTPLKVSTTILPPANPDRSGTHKLAEDMAHQLRTMRLACIRLELDIELLRKGPST